MASIENWKMNQALSPKSSTFILYNGGGILNILKISLIPLTRKIK